MEAASDMVPLSIFAKYLSRRTEVHLFQECFKSRWSTNFRASEIANTRKRFESIRRPQNLVNIDVIGVVRNYTC